MHEPTNAQVMQTLRDLRALARIPLDPHDLFTKLISEIIWEEWRFEPTDASINSWAVSWEGVARAIHVALTNSNNERPTREDAEGEPKSERAAMQLELLERVHEVAHVLELIKQEAEANKPQRGGQSKPVKGRGAQRFDVFAGSVYLVVRDLGGKLTVNRNDISWGTFPAFLEVLRNAKILPVETFRGMSARRLDRIKNEMDTEYRAAS